MYQRSLFNTGNITSPCNRALLVLKHTKDGAALARGNQIRLLFPRQFDIPHPTIIQNETKFLPDATSIRNVMRNGE